MRAAVLARDAARSALERSPACRVRVPGVCVGQSNPMHVHHLDGKAHGDDPARLVASCAPCNLHIGEPAGPADPPCTPITRWRDTPS